MQVFSGSEATRAFMAFSHLVNLSFQYLHSGWHVSISKSLGSCPLSIIALMESRRRELKREKIEGDCYLPLKILVSKKNLCLCMFILSRCVLLKKREKGNREQIYSVSFY